MFKVLINKEKCTACKKCIDVCPADMLGIVDSKAAVKEGCEDECLGCDTDVIDFWCVDECETDAISIVEE